MDKFKSLSLMLIAGLLVGCSSSSLGYNAQGQVVNALARDNNLLLQPSHIESANAQQVIEINQLKNSVYGLFFKQGIFAGQDNLGSPDFKYQRWQVPLVIGSMIDVNRNYLGQFHDFLPNLAIQSGSKYPDYQSFLDAVYRVNNWDTFAPNEQKLLCQSTVHCLYIDDRLWWVNAFLGYAEGLLVNNPQDPNLAKMLDYAYKIFVDGITRDDYINEIATPGAKSVMWFSGVGKAAEYKSTISNSLYVTAGARLAKLIKFKYGEDDPQYDYTRVLKDTQSVADGYFLAYFDKLNSDGLLMDGVITRDLDVSNKDLNGKVVNQIFTYNQGVVLPGMAILAQLTGKTKYLKFAKKLVVASYAISLQHAGFWDDYGYLQANGWFADGDGIAFRLAYWQYFSLFLENYNLTSDLKFRQLVEDFVANNARQVVVRPVNLTNYGMSAYLKTAMSPNHNDFPNLPRGKAYTSYPDGYSVPGTAAALELLVLQQRVQNFSLQQKN